LRKLKLIHELEKAVVGKTSGKKDVRQRKMSPERGQPINAINSISSIAIREVSAQCSSPLHTYIGRRVGKNAKGFKLSTLSAFQIRYLPAGNH